MTTFQAIWLSPRATIQKVVTQQYTGTILALLCLAGIAQTLDRAVGRNVGDRLPLAAILGLAFVAGPFATLFCYWIWSHLVAWTGDFLKGKGNQAHILAAIAWSKIPVAFALPVWFVMIFAAGRELFSEETPTLESNPTLLVIVGVGALIVAALNIWSLVLLCNTVAEVQGFSSAWKGLLNVFLGALAGLLPVAAILVLLILVLKA